MKFRIETIDDKLMIGRHEKMSFADNKTMELWQGFMKSRKDITGRIDNRYYSMQIFNSKFDYSRFNPATTFAKWAVVEVKDFSTIPEGMDAYTLRGGTYAVFEHVGPAITFGISLQYIFEQWLPNSEYEVDDRVHFEILPEDYNPTDENATEEIWIPVMRGINLG